MAPGKEMQHKKLIHSLLPKPGNSKGAIVALKNPRSAHQQQLRHKQQIAKVMFEMEAHPFYAKPQ
jgi:hypothetical protein|tara:strand:+ start:108 stop:302 length:195 start_codon:yes stop_codon:yes gene_type:complete